MRITFDPAKRDQVLAERGLDFADAPKVFGGVIAEADDMRKDYGEVRVVCFGWLNARLVQIVYTPRDEGRHIITMRKANAREKKRLASIFGFGPEES